ncbi:MAG: helix-hairpin-helix domain-containing protein [Nitrospinae bacterium]|nr:helix-hairpin-helix domain-containing protein [Nitrospinota bacterium]
MKKRRQKALIELQTIPGVGRTIAQDFLDIGLHSVKDLKRKNPETLYEKLCAHQGKKIDRCMLYVFRCAVYFATEKNPKPELLKWWNWKDPEGSD